MRGYQLQRELKKLTKSLQKRESLDKKYKLLEDDYKNLLASYERSEVIRKKQKKLIEELKQDVDDKVTTRKRHN